MSKHTPGPWEAADRGDYGDFDGQSRVILSDDMRIAVVHDNGRPETEANTLLITAAPDMLAALKDAIGALEFSRDFHSDLSNEDQALAQDRLDAALKAIAKAEGRTDA